MGSELITATALDGTGVRAFDEGRGPVILFLHGGMDEGASWKKVAARLASRFRVLRLHRRQYRRDLKAREACTMAEEVAHVRALVESIDEPMLIVGHSSGAVLALEALVALPEAFAGAVLYEPPCVVGPPLGGEALTRAQAAMAAGRPGRALAVFLRDIVRAPAWTAWMTGVCVPVFPQLARLAPHQLDDCEAIDGLGLRLDAYARIGVPVVLLGGERSPAHLGERLDALERAIPETERVRMRRQGHAANSLAPGKVAEIVGEFGDRVMRRPSR
ncbi:pimeloyl-ACP methyl ester carboxylesterase [Stackebrandtia albiflava]|uniref:Pimeloyl-ACP methyl ester carboxylesterase n=1 Tax=Stackebrandtia albiflava TaxID=406432 RepID=A0A562VDV0_9ACTN|nr:alpha/beta hydrolase [Stackebrandtia albiflava]TWJ16038.1 pimeloyl-ACP methyl ester carboxylesterase [Stackebrandtia albiflava]